MPFTAITLTGGGARAAYQVGALRALDEILCTPKPFSIFTGVSAGAINSTVLAAGADDFGAATAHLEETWRDLVPEQVYRTDPRSLLGIGSRWIVDLSAGAIFGAGHINYLLDTSPLRELLEKRIAFRRMADHFESGALHGVAVSATNYLTGTAVTTFDGSSTIQPWTRSRRIGRREAITVSHVMASAAIPIFFPPVEVDGVFFGDGCVRLSSPLSPSFHLGADRVVVIGIRFPRSSETTDELHRTVRPPNLALSDIAGTLLNAVFLDSMESDVERVERINHTLTLLTPDARAQQSLRTVPLLVLRPSCDLGKLAENQYHRFPRSLRYLLKGIGANGDTGWDLLSYLAFEPGYVHTLIDLGYADTLARRKEVEAFFSDTAQR
jgi:NTE family protein